MTGETTIEPVKSDVSMGNPESPIDALPERKPEPNTFGIRERLRTKRANLKSKVATAGVSGIGMYALTGLASANTTETTDTINWTSIGDMISNVGSIMPDIVSLVSSVVPVILMLIVVGFVISFFDSIIDAISSAFRIFKR